MVNFFVTAINYFVAHPIFNSVVHAIAGFGLAIVLQHHSKGNSFVSVWVGWLCLALSIGAYVYALMQQ